MYCNLDYTNEIDMSVIDYTNPRKSSGGSYISQCYFRKDDNSNVPIIFETPSFSFSEIKLIKNKPYIQINLSKETESFFDFITKMRTYNISYANSKSTEWFSKVMPIKYLEDYHTSMIENKESESIINLSLPCENDEINVNITDFDNEQLDITKLSNRKIKCGVKIDTIKFLRKELICNLTVLKIQAQKENVLELIKENNNTDLVINKFDESMISFSNKSLQSNIDEESLQDEQQEETVQVVQTDQPEETEQLEQSDEANEADDDEETVKAEEAEEAEETEETAKAEETEHAEKSDNDGSVEENLYIENNDDDDDDEDEDVEFKESVNNLKMDELEPLNIDTLEHIGQIDIDDYNNFNNFKYEEEEDDQENKQDNNLKEELDSFNNSIKEAEEEYTKNLQMLNEQEKLLDTKRKELEEFKKKNINNEKQLCL
jgi:hypothetical protein